MLLSEALKRTIFSFSIQQRYQLFIRIRNDINPHEMIKVLNFNNQNS